MPESTDGPRDAPRPRRRPRYAGTHPRRFEQRYKELAPDQFPQVQAHIRAQGRTPAGTHVPVLIDEVLHALRPQAGEIAVDCTLGFGGHAVEIARRIGPTGLLIGVDIDTVEIERTRARLSAIAVQTPLARLALHHANFAGLPRVLATEDVAAVDLLLADLGVSSMQIDNPERGFSYKVDGPLDMRLDPQARRTAADVLRSMSEADLAAAFAELADEPDAEEIATRIVAVRADRPLVRTSQLIAIVSEVKRRARRVGPHGSNEDSDKHPSARTFQALRMLVNDELGRLGELLRVAPQILNAGGRLAIISFHSGEDRLVKQALRDGRAAGAYAEISDEPVRPSGAERRSNPRAAPARLRWAVRG